jgi:hypothetical protein
VHQRILSKPADRAAMRPAISMSAAKKPSAGARTRPAASSDHAWLSLSVGSVAAARASALGRQRPLIEP